MSLDAPSFNALGLTPDLIRVVADQGYTTPTPVQAEAIPLVLAGRDVLAGAQTGTGKTAAFVLPILQLLHGTRPDPRHLPIGNGRPRGATGLPIRCLVLAPTRELALQVEESVRTYGAQRPIRSTTIYGGVGFDPQVRALRSGPEIVVATPGRLLDHVGQRTIDLSTVEILVLDEADRMLDMGFIRDIRRILALLPARRQNLLFSATFSDDIRNLANGLLQNPAFVQVTRRNTASELVAQLAYPVDRERKRELLSHLIRSGRIDQALVFTRTKHGANRLAEQLTTDGISAVPIHGNRSQGQRVRALDDFKSGRVAILVATELAARGLDIEALPHVVNYELPMTPEDYVHRIGRTGRAGVDGQAISLVCVDESRLLREIEGVLGHRIPSEVVPGFEPNPAIRPEAIRLRTGIGQPTSGGRSGGGQQNSSRPSSYGTRPPMGDRPNGGHRSAGGDDRSNQAPRPGSERDGFAPARRPGYGSRPSQPHRSVQSSVPGQGIGRPAPAGRPAGRADARPSNHRAPHPPHRAGPAGPGLDARPQPDLGRAVRRMDAADLERSQRRLTLLPGERLLRSNRP